MLQRLVELWPREKGNGWQLAKIHEQLHVPDDIHRNGSPHTTHTGPTENHHIQHVKRYRRQTNRRRDTFDWQVGNRFAETFLIDTAMHRMTFDYEGKIQSDKGLSTETNYGWTGRGVLVVSVRRRHDIGYDFEWENKSHVNSNTEFDESVFQFLCQWTVDTWEEPLHLIPPHIEYKMKTSLKKDGIIYRADPSCRGQRWHDWVMLRWRKEPNDRFTYNRSKVYNIDHTFGDPPEMMIDHHYAPAQLLAFVQNVDGTYDAVVKCCRYDFFLCSVFTT